MAVGAVKYFRPVKQWHVTDIGGEAGLFEKKNWLHFIICEPNE